MNPLGKAGQRAEEVWKASSFDLTVYYSPEQPTVFALFAHKLEPGISGFQVRDLLIALRASDYARVQLHISAANQWSQNNHKNPFDSSDRAHFTKIFEKIMAEKLQNYVFSTISLFDPSE